MRRLTVALFAFVSLAPHGCTQTAAKADADEGGVSIQAELIVDRSVYGPGDTIAARLVIRNPGPDALVLSFPTAQRFELEVRASSPTPLWTWSGDRTFAQVLREERVAPGESLEYEERFAAPGVAGSYRLLGWITALDRDLRAEVPFEGPVAPPAILQPTRAPVLPPGFDLALAGWRCEVATSPTRLGPCASLL